MTAATAVDLGEGVTAHIDTGDDGPVLAALEHHCRLDDGTAVTMTVQADAYVESHQAVFDRQGRLTVRPAVGCDCCGLYGEITDDVFTPLEADR